MFDVGERIQNVRKQRLLTQKALAQRINKSVSAVSSYESNTQMPPLDVLISIASALNVSLDYLVGFDSKRNYQATSLDANQIELLDLLFAEFCAPTSIGDELSAQQIEILRKLILIFQ